MNQSVVWSQVYAFLTVLLWSSAFVFTKIALEYFSATSLGLIRCFVATLFLMSIVLLQRKSIPALKYIPIFIASGVSGFSLYLVTFNIGSSMLNPTTSCVIISLSPVIAAVFAAAIFREKLRLLQWLSIFMAFCGILIMTLWHGTLAVSSGIFWMLSAAFLFSLYSLLQRWLSRQFDPFQITAYSFFWGTITLLCFTGEAVEKLHDASVSMVALACFLAIFPSAIASICWVKALSLAKNTSSVTNYVFLTPLLSLLLEYIFIGSLPGVETFIGGGVILLSLGIFTACKTA